MPFFGQKLLNTQHGVGRYTPKSPTMKWATALKVSSKQFLNLSVSMPFSASAMFVSPLPPQREFPFEDFFHPGNQRKLLGAGGEIWWMGRVGHGGHAFFWSKTAEHSARCGQVRSESPIKKWANALRVFKKRFTEAEAASHNTSWYSDTEGFLVRSPSREVT